MFIGSFVSLIFKLYKWPQTLKEIHPSFVTVKSLPTNLVTYHAHKTPGRNESFRRNAPAHSLQCRRKEWLHPFRLSFFFCLWITPSTRLRVPSREIEGCCIAVPGAKFPCEGRKIFTGSLKIRRDPAFSLHPSLGAPLGWRYAKRSLEILWPSSLSFLCWPGDMTVFGFRR